jgi:prepilin-type N-terminal cleavage/methylation domain-containing protein
VQRSLHSQTFRTLAGERTAGVTLIELLMVIALIAIIFGSGLGMFAGLNPARRATVGLVQNTLRSAHNSSVARQAPARVRFDLASKRKDPDAKLQPDTMTAAGMRVIGTWHFEDDQLRGAFGLDGVNLGGYLVDDGFQGKALSFNGAAPESRIEIGVHQDPAYDFRYGFDIGMPCGRSASRARAC